MDVSPDAVPLNLNQVDPDTLRMSVEEYVADAMFQGGHIGRDGPRELIRNVHWIFTTQFGSRCRQVSFCRDLLIIIYYAISSFKLI